MKEQPTALRLADELAVFATWRDDVTGALGKSAAELRRLHEANRAMLEALKSIKDRLDTSPTYVMLASEVFDSFYQQIIDEAIAKGEKS